MSTPPENTPLGESISEIIDRTTKIVHEEIELAKAEMSVALQDLLRGSVAGIVGGVFAFFGLFIILIGIAFLISDVIDYGLWPGFLIVALLSFVIGGLLALVALKKIKKGSQLTPSQAISEAKQTRDALQAEADTPIESIDSVAVEEPSAGSAPAAVATPVKPATDPAVVEAKEDLKEAREDANELHLDAKELKKRAKQEAKEAKEAAKAAKVAEQEAAKADAIAAKAAEKAEREAAKAKAQAEKDASKAAKAAEKQAKKGGEQPPQAPPALDAKPYVAPRPPAQPPAVPQRPPAPPSQTPPPAQPPQPPRDTSTPYDPKSDE
ncbi:MAG: phage holin family protein [Solirubrobacterales bacterium]|nr:phage holin family protein [Solirubrobacterales bacterium]